MNKRNNYKAMYKEAVKILANGRTICNCGEAYEDEEGRCAYGCSTNLIRAKHEIVAALLSGEPDDHMVRVHPDYFVHLRSLERAAIRRGEASPTDWERTPPTSTNEGAEGERMSERERVAEFLSDLSIHGCFDMKVARQCLRAAALLSGEREPDACCTDGWHRTASFPGYCCPVCGQSWKGERKPDGEAIRLLRRLTDFMPFGTDAATGNVYCGYCRQVTKTHDHGDHCEWKAAEEWLAAHPPTSASEGGEYVCPFCGKVPSPNAERRSHTAEGCLDPNARQPTSASEES